MYLASTRRCSTAWPATWPSRSPTWTCPRFTSASATCSAPADGTYFQCVRYDAISQESEAQFAEWLTAEIKVAAIPVSAFYTQGKESGIVRFCFAKKDETLQLALERLRTI